MNALTLNNIFECKSLLDQNKELAKYAHGTDKPQKMGHRRTKVLDEE